MMKYKKGILLSVVALSAAFVAAPASAHTYSLKLEGCRAGGYNGGTMVTRGRWKGFYHCNYIGRAPGGDVAIERKLRGNSALIKKHGLRFDSAPPTLPAKSLDKKPAVKPQAVVEDSKGKGCTENGRPDLKAGPCRPEDRR